MQWIVVATPPFKAVEHVDEVLVQLDGEPPGLEARYVGSADDGKLRVVSLWASKADADRFFAEDLGPAYARVMGPEPVGAPEAVGIKVERSFLRGLTA